MNSVSTKIKEELKAVIEKAKIEKIKKQSKKEIILEISEEIKELYTYGYTTEEILEMIKKGGVELKKSTLKNYLTKKPKGIGTAASPPPPGARNRRSHTPPAAAATGIEFPPETKTVSKTVSSDFEIKKDDLS